MMADDADVLKMDSLSYQRAVIGSMLIDDRCVGAVLAKLAPEDFSDGPCRSAYRAIKGQFLAGLPVDPVLIQGKIGGGEAWARWAAELMQETPTAANAEFYADEVRKWANFWRQREQAGKILSALTPDESDQLARGMAGLVGTNSRGRTVTAEELARDFHQRITSPEKPEYLPWGIPSADRDVHAELGDVILLGGYASAGKTLLSIQMALAQAKRYKVVYYTLETQLEKMADRIFAHLAKIPLTEIKTRNLSEMQISRAASAENLFVSKTPLTFVQAAKFTVADIAADAVSKGAQIVYIDYLQLIEGDGRRSSYERVSEISREIKVFAQSHKIAVVALAQLSRAKETEKHSQVYIPPSMQSFRDSGQIEQDADAAFLLWPEDQNNNNSRRVLKLAKNKEGPKFTRRLDFNGPTQTMVELENDDDEDEAEPKANVARQLAAAGRAAKAANRGRRMTGQVQFQEVNVSDADNPFLGGGT